MKIFEFARRIVTDLLLYVLALYGLWALVAASPLIKVSLFG